MHKSWRREVYQSLFDALWHGFFFNDSPQKHDYWESVCNRAEAGEFDKPAIPWPYEAKWRCITNEGGERSVRSSRGFICFMPKPNHYQGQDERYSQEIAEYESNQILIAVAPEMYNALIEAKAQIEKFSETGSGNQVLSKINALLDKATL